MNQFHRLDKTLAYTFGLFSFLVNLAYFLGPPNVSAVCTRIGVAARENNKKNDKEEYDTDI